jgi:hypothetical protein
MMIGFHNMPPDMILEEELSVIQKGFGDFLDERYGDEDVDLCFVTHEGMYDEDQDPHPEGWGLSEDEMWDKIPGETREEKAENVKRIMAGEKPKEFYDDGEEEASS